MRKSFLAAVTIAAATTFFAGAPTASADACHLTWDIPCCPIPGTNIGAANAVLTICNCTDIDAEYRFVMKGPPGVSFMPPDGIVTLAPGECIDVPIMVICGPNAPQGFLFRANVFNTSTGFQFSCDGSIRPSGTVKVVPENPATDVPANGTPAQVTFVATNMGTTTGIDFEFAAMGPVVVVNPPPSPFPLPPGQTRSFTLDLVALPTPDTGGPNMPVFYDVLVKFDNGSGVMEVNSSVGGRVVRGGPCRGDLNGDGVVNSADLALVLGAWGPCP